MEQKSGMLALLIDVMKTMAVEIALRQVEQEGSEAGLA